MIITSFSDIVECCETGNRFFTDLSETVSGQDKKIYHYIFNHILKLFT